MGRFTSGGNPYDKRRVYQRIHQRLSTQPEFSDVQYLPSRNRPREIHAVVDVERFLDHSYRSTTARVEIEFIFRQDWNHYWIQWVEPERGFSCGWHQDNTHTDLGHCHFQIDYPDGSVEREEAALLDAHPLSVVETRLQSLLEKLAAMSFE